MAQETITIQRMYQIINNKAIEVPGPQHEARITMLENSLPTVVSTPVLPISTIPIGFSTTFQVSAVSMLNPPQDIVKFILNIPEFSIVEQEFTATNNTATVSFNIPSTLEEGKTIDVYLQAVDSADNRSKIAANKLTAVKGRITKPSVLTPTANAVVYYNSGAGISVTSSQFNTTGMEDTHEATKWGIFSNAELSTSIVIDESNTDLTSHIFQDQNLVDGQTYYVAVQYKGTLIGQSIWSEPRPFTATKAYVAQPTGNSPKDNTEVRFNSTGVVLTSSEFATIGSTDTHTKSDWYIYSDSACTQIVASLADATTDLLTHTFTGLTLTDGQTYYWRCRHYGQRLGWSEWSTAQTFKARAAFINNPTINSPSSNANIVYNDTGLTVTTSAFSVDGGTDTHIATHYYIASDVNCNSIVVQDLNSTELLSHTFTVSQLSVLSNDTTYYVFAKHKGSKYGDSGYSVGVPFKTKKAYITKPTILTPSANADIYYSIGFDTTANAFTAVNGTDTHKKSNWKITSDNAGSDILVSKSLTTGTLTDYSFTANDLSSLVNQTTYYLFVQYEGNKFGLSEWSNAVAFKANFGYVNKTNVTLSASSIYPNETLTVTTDNFSTVGTDTHASTDWKICSDSAGNTVVISALDSSDKLSHTFAKNQLTAGTYYVFARHKGTALGYGEWSSSKTLTVNAAYVNTPTLTIDTTGIVYPNTAITVTGSTFTITGSDSITHTKTDWQVCSTNSSSGTVVWSSLDDETNQTSISIPANILTEGTYYVFVRYNNTSYGWSSWSSSATLTITAPYVNTPSISSPSDNAEISINNTQITVTASNFSVTGTTDIHKQSTWKITTDTAGSNIVETVTSTSDKTSHTFAISDVSSITSNQYLYLWVQYEGTNVGTSSWSSYRRIAAKIATVNTPTVTLDSTSVYPNETVTLTGSSFGMSYGSGIHDKTDWAIFTSDNTSGTAEWSSLNDITNKTTITVPKNSLTSGTKYIACRYYDSVTATWSAWSSTKTLTIKAVVVNTPSVTLGSTSIYPNATLKITGSTFSVTGSDTSNHSKTDWKICTSNSSSGTAEWSSLNNTSNKTSITVPANSLTPGTRYVFVRYYDNTSSTWSSWSSSAVITVQTPIITAPTILTPAANSTVASYFDLAINASAFHITGSTDTHAMTDWKTTNSSSSTVLSSTNDVTNLTSITFAKSQLANFTDGATYTIKARYKGTTYGWSSWSEGRSFKFTKNLITASGREIYRHSSNEGSVIIFDMFGTTVNLLVLDCRWRTVLSFGTYGKESTLSDYSDTGPNGTWIIDGSTTSVLSVTDAAPVITDTQLQTIWAMFSTDKTARANCDVWMEYQGTYDSSGKLGVPAVEYVRGLSISGISNGFDIPNEYELMVLRIEGEYLDSLDKYKDDTTYNKYLFGRSKPNGNWFGWGGYRNTSFSSTTYNKYNIRCVAADGRCDYERKSYDCGVTPVREL